MGTVIASHERTWSRRNALGPSACIELDWVSASDKPRLVALAESLSRQTMNMRLPTARMIWARHAGQVVGWVGIDIDHDPERPELFSLYLDPSYRAQQLSRTLRLAATSFLLRRGVRHVLGRIAVSEGMAAMQYWLASGACRPATADETPNQFAVMCTRCNLYGNACSERVFMRLDVERVHADDSAKLAQHADYVLPLQLEIAVRTQLKVAS